MPKSADSPLAHSRPIRLTPTEGGRGAETRERLLDAAERIFAERGFEGASIRAVTQAAGASVSAANYHFGSKEALLRETLSAPRRPAQRATARASRCTRSRSGRSARWNSRRSSIAFPAARL